MKRLTGAAALSYVVLAAIENMELLGAPGLGAPAAEVRAVYDDTALSVVTTGAGALSLACYAAFAALLAKRWLPAAMAGAALAAAGVCASAGLIGGGDPALYDLQLQLRYLAGPFMAVFLFGAATALPRPLRLAARCVAVPLALAARARVVRARRPARLRRARRVPLGGRPVARRGRARLRAPGRVPDARRGRRRGALGLRAAATFLHLEVFDFDRLQAWAWVALFAAFGATTTWLAVTGPWERPAGPALAGWARGLLGVAAAALFTVAVALWIDPAGYSLPPLGGRFAGSWAAMLAVLAAGVAALRAASGVQPAATRRVRPAPALGPPRSASRALPRV
jgi:hypothetical protein